MSDDSVWFGLETKLMELSVGSVFKNDEYFDLQ